MLRYIELETGYNGYNDDGPALGLGECFALFVREVFMSWVYVADFWLFVLLIGAIKSSSRRLLSFGYAVGGFVLVLVLGLVAMFLLTPRSGTVGEVNAVLDMIGMAVTLAAPIAAVVGAHQPPRREKA
jgi:hypothetical protein